MAGIKAFLATALLAVACFFGPGTLAAQTELTLDQSRALARQALVSGDLNLAEGLSRALLEANDSDITALLTLSSVFIRKKAPQQALGFARRAFAAASTDNEKFIAARLAADALEDMNALERSKLWLRRAIEFAPDEAATSESKAKFAALRRQSPWSTQLQFGIAPNSNVNNGTENETIEIYGLTFSLNDAEPLSGYFLTGLISSSYRFAASNNSESRVGFSIYHRETILTDEAKALTDQTGSDFAYSALAVNLRHNFVLPNRKTRWGLAAELGQTFYGQTRLAVRQSLSFSAQRRLAEGVVGNVSLRLTDERNQRDRISDYRQAALSFGLAWQIPDWGVLRVTPSFWDTNSQSATVAHRRYGATVSFSPAGDFQGIKGRFQLGYYARHDDEFTAFAPSRRRDEGFELRARIYRPDWEFYGFSPHLVFEAKRTKSNVTLYDTKGYASWLELRSSF